MTKRGTALGDEVGERHGVGVGGLLRALQLRLNVGWGEFEDFDVGIAELVAERLRPGVDGGLGGAVGGCRGQRKEREAGA